MKHYPAKSTWPALKARIEARCHEIGECLVYESAQQRPSVSFKVRRVWHRAELRQIYWVVTGRDLPDGLCVTSTCGDPKCIAHLVTCTLRRAQQAAGRRGSYSCPVKVAKIAASRRKGSKYSDELIDEVRNGTEPAANLAARTGMAISYVYALRRGNGRVPLANSSPWAGLFGRGGA